MQQHAAESAQISTKSTETSEQNRQLVARKLFSFSARTYIVAAVIALVGVIGVTSAVALSDDKAETHPASTVIKPEASSTAPTQSDVSKQEEGTMSNDDSNQTTGNATNSSNTNVTVNGRSIDVPANGNYNQMTTDANGTTSVTVQSSHSGSATAGSATSDSNVNVNIQSNSSQSSE
jgi:hypothetical protein